MILVGIVLLYFAFILGFVRWQQYKEMRRINSLGHLKWEIDNIGKIEK